MTAVGDKMAETIDCRSERRPSRLSAENGQALLALLVAATLVTIISISLLDLMNTDVSHATIQYAVSRSYYIAQAGLAEATSHVFAAADPSSDTTSAAGVTESYGGGQFSYWVDAGPATGCGVGLKTLEARGEVKALGRMISARVRACAVPGTPFLAALFGVSRVEFQGIAETYLAPYDVGSPGGGGNLGSFTEINFADDTVRLNALSEGATNVVAVHDGTFSDYALFGFTARPDYNPTAMDEPTPWILAVFGDLIKAQPTTGIILNRCGTPYGCVTVGNNITDVPGVSDLRDTSYRPHVYVKRLRQETVPPLALDSAIYERAAAHNTANADLNALAGLTGKHDSRYDFGGIYRVLSYMALNPGRYLQGTVYIDGSLNVPLNMNLGGPSGNVTFAVAGDLVIQSNSTLMNTHDLTTAAGRRTVGIVVLGTREPSPTSTQVCGAQTGQAVNGSGRLVMCEGSTLVVDGLVYTQDGMVIRPGAFVDQVGAMYHNSRGTGNPSFTMRDATVVLRFDPPALAAFGKGATILSWQQLH